MNHLWLMRRGMSSHCALLSEYLDTGKIERRGLYLMIYLRSISIQEWNFNWISLVAPKLENMHMYESPNWFQNIETRQGHRQTPTDDRSILTIILMLW